MMSRYVRPIPAFLVLIVALSVLSVPGAGRITAQNSREITLEDFSDVVTRTDRGLNDFSGNMGVLNDRYITDFSLQCPSGTPPCALQLSWDFATAIEDYTGLFFSLFGLTDTVVSFDRTTTVPLSFPEHSLDLDRIDGVVNAHLPGRAVEHVCFAATYTGGGALQLKAEIKDAQSPTQGFRSAYFTLLPAPTVQSFCWDFRTSFTPGSPDVNLRQAKVLSFIIERQNSGAGVSNPQTGTLRLQRIWFTTNQMETQPANDAELLDLLELRTYQYFIDWSSRKPDSAGIPQDRSTFGDLLTVGGIGFALPAHIIAAERGWITRAEARTRVLSVLRVLDQPAAFGPEPIGRIGYRGWFYHFLGTDGRRKQNFDFPDTPCDESQNTVEISSIDTGLALMGVLAAQSYFSGADPEEVEIRIRAQAIYDRVDWNFMLDHEKQQFYLGWKPNEARESFPPFAFPGQPDVGRYAGTITQSQTLDFYTDEALILVLLALGSTQEPAISPEIYAALVRQCDQDLIKTFPGTLFTYQFLLAFIDTRAMWTRPACGATATWFENTQVATSRVIAYAEQNPRGFATYGPNAWGIAAAEGPFDSYHAYGAPPLAAWNTPEEDGTVTYYGMVSAVSLGPDYRTRVIAAVRNAWNRGDWHPRFGLPDAFNDNIAQANPPGDALRQAGPWKQRALFAINQGPMLLHLENARSGLIWSLLARNPNIQRGWARLYERVYLPMVRR
jgi:hypothetical protein